LAGRCLARSRWADGMCFWKNLVVSWYSFGSCCWWISGPGSYVRTDHLGFSDNGMCLRAFGSWNFVWFASGAESFLTVVLRDGFF